MRLFCLGHPSRKFRRSELWIRRPGLLVDEHKVHEAQGFWNPRGYLDSPRGESPFTPKITHTEPLVSLEHLGMDSTMVPIARTMHSMTTWRHRTRKRVSVPDHLMFVEVLIVLLSSTAMFFIGSNVMDWPLETQRAVADGEQQS